MRKLFILIICMAFGTVAFAQKSQELYLSLGTLPFDFMVDDTPYGQQPSIYDLYDAYESQYCNSRYTPLFGLEYHTFLTDRIQLGAGAAYYHSTADLYDPVEDLIVGKRFVNAMYLTAQFRYCYQHTERGQVYSGAELGAKLSLTSNPSQKNTFRPSPAWDLILIGVSYGKTLTFYSEVVAGNTLTPYRFGLGYKF